MTVTAILNQARLSSPPVDPDHLAPKKYVDEQVGAVTGRLNTLGPLASAADAPANGRPHVRQDGGWREQAAAASGGGAIVGEIRLLPFRRADLPTAWYFCNGDRYEVTSAVGKALSALPAAMRADWGIAVSGTTINLPSLFNGADGYFLRPVNNSSRYPGNIQWDAIRNITGSLNLGTQTGFIFNGTALGTTTFEGAFAGVGFNKMYSFAAFNHGYNTVGDLAFDASRLVPTATENRPLNIGMTPAIYLGA